MTAVLQFFGLAAKKSVSSVLPARDPSDDYARDLTDAQISLMNKIAEEERASWVSHKRES